MFTIFAEIKDSNCTLVMKAIEKFGELNVAVFGSTLCIATIFWRDLEVFLRANKIDNAKLTYER